MTDNTWAHRFPSEREPKRAALLGAVEDVREVLAAHAAETEQQRTLAAASVQALRESGLFALKVPEAVGGAEADPVTQMDVIEAVVQIDPAAAWCMFISSAVTGSVSARLPDEAIAELFAGGRLPTMAGSLKPGGTAVPVDGGYLVSGRWAWGSGVRHATHVSAQTFVQGDEPRLVGIVAPIADVEIHDNWHVMGMVGTGSCDWSLTDVFVPEHFVTDAAHAPQFRGGALYRLGMPGYVINEHAAFAFGLARRVLHSVASSAAEKRRGYLGAVSIADRAVFQRAVAEADLKLRAARLLMVEVLERLFAAAECGPPSAALQAEARAAGVMANDVALDVVSSLYRYAGGDAIRLDGVVQRCRRDLDVAQSHLVVSDSAYENHGAFLLGVTDTFRLG